jgi:hypothetical protein
MDEQVVSDGIVLKWVVGKWAVEMRVGLSWLDRESSGWLLNYGRDEI